MKKNLNYLLYGIALFLILIPIGYQEITRQVLSPVVSGMLLATGILFLITGKLCVIRKKRSGAREPIYMDLSIIIVLLAMFVWIFIKEIL